MIRLLLALLLLGSPAAAQQISINPPYAVGQIPGTATNDNAAAGFVGQVISASVASGSPISLTTSTAANLTSISLTPGDWDVNGYVAVSGTGTTTFTLVQSSISTTSATIGSLEFAATQQYVTGLALFTSQLRPPTTRVSINATTTVYLVVNSIFASSTASAYGSMSARRMR